MGNFAFTGAAAASSARTARQGPRMASLGDLAGVSDPGRSREHNEDSWRVVRDPGLLLLADGMGGYNAGEIAAELAIDCVARFAFEEPVSACSVDPLEQLAAAISTANASILAAAARRPECLGMGTTIAVAWVCGSRLFHAHVGDSRIYLLRRRRLARLTRDHSVGQAMIDAGVRERPGSLQASLRGVLTRALGVETTVEPDFGEVALEPGDRLLLCSDGVSDFVDDAQTARILAREAPAAELADALVRTALGAGGSDNATAVVAVFEDAGSGPR
jgi:protein phosphatase